MEKAAKTIYNETCTLFVTTNSSVRIVSLLKYSNKHNANDNPGGSPRASYHLNNKIICCPACYHLRLASYVMLFSCVYGSVQKQFSCTCIKRYENSLRLFNVASHTGTTTWSANGRQENLSTLSRPTNF